MHGPGWAEPQKLVPILTPCKAASSRHRAAALRILVDPSFSLQVLLAQCYELPIPVSRIAEACSAYNGISQPTMAASVEENLGQPIPSDTAHVRRTP